MDSIKLKIFLCSYAYRDKRIIDTIIDAIDLADNANQIGISIAIQDSYQHEINLSKDIYKKNIHYYPWQNRMGFAIHRNSIIQSIDNDAYILFINPGTKFIKSWDTKLKKIINNQVISLKENIFSFNGTFIKKEDLDKIYYPTYLKLLGEEEDISIKLYSENISIVSGIETIIEPGKNKSWDYIPFSENHMYNETVKLYKNGKNNFCSINNSFIDYSTKYPIKTIFYQTDDPLYTNQMIALENSIDRFLHYKNKI